MNVCKRCGHEWQPRMKGRPASCPACKSYKWDEETTRQRTSNLEYDDKHEYDADALGRDNAAVKIDEDLPWG